SRADHCYVGAAGDRDTLGRSWNAAHCCVMLALTDGGSVDGAVGADSKRGDFALGRFVKYEPVCSRLVGGALGRFFREPQNAAARLCAGDQISLRIESQNTDVGFVA